MEEGLRGEEGREAEVRIYERRIRKRKKKILIKILFIRAGKLETASNFINGN